MTGSGGGLLIDVVTGSGGGLLIDVVTGSGGGLLIDVVLTYPFHLHRTVACQRQVLWRVICYLWVSLPLPLLPTSSSMEKGAWMETL